MIEKNNILFGKIAETDMKPITYHYITFMSKARNYNKKEHRIKKTSSAFLKTMSSDFYQTDFMYLGVQDKKSIIL